MEEFIAIASAVAIYWIYTLLARQGWFRRGPGLAMSLAAAAYFIVQAVTPGPGQRSIRILLAITMIRGAWMQWKIFQEARHDRSTPAGVGP